MFKKKLPIGISDFKELIEKNYYFVDKSLLIKELLISGAKVTLIPRPRRFGKTLNLSMLRYFFEKREESNRNLFKNLAISKDSESMKEQGKRPVIYLTLKSAKSNNWEESYEKIIRIISDEFARHIYLLRGSTLLSFEKKEFEKILDLSAKRSVYSNSLRKLSFYLHRYHKEKPIILIDEYDAPIHAGYESKYYDEIVTFMRSFLGEGLKDNIDLEFSVMTGILKVAKESIFSDMNNLEVCTILDESYSSKFGLLEEEVEILLKYYELFSELKESRKWYNGYMFGGHIIYNPWSIINFAKSKGVFQPYWINTSQNQIIKELIIKKNSEVTKMEVEQLMQGDLISKPIGKNIVLSEAFSGGNELWSFLLFSGYLTFKNQEVKESGETFVGLKIPNTEVRYFFQKTITNWFTKSSGEKAVREILESLVLGNVNLFSKLFKKFVLNSFSYFDVSGRQPESFYHSFTLGLLTGLQNTHSVKSNRESGYGRYDIMIIPKDKSKLGIVIEFKKIDKEEEKDLEHAAQNALKQIEDKKYEQELKDQGIKKIIKLAIVFDGKKVLVKY